MLIAWEIPSPARAGAPSVCARKGCLRAIDGKGCFGAIAARRQNDVVVRALHAPGAVRSLSYLKPGSVTKGVLVSSRAKFSANIKSVVASRMSSRRSRAAHADRADSEQPSLPPVDPPPTDDTEGDGQDDIDDSRRGDDVSGGPGALVEAGRGPGVSQEFVTAAVLDALSNPDVIFWTLCQTRTLSAGSSLQFHLALAMVLAPVRQRPQLMVSFSL